MVEPGFLEILKLLENRLSKVNISWALTGSTNFALQGLAYVPSDIDIQTDRKGAFEIESLFKDFIVKKVTFSTNRLIRSYFGELNINGIPVEIIGDMEKLVDGEWEKAPKINEIKQYIIVGDLHLPVLSLQYEAKAYQKLGRVDKAEAIIKHIKTTQSLN